MKFTENWKSECPLIVTIVFIESVMGMGERDGCETT